MVTFNANQATTTLTVATDNDATDEANADVTATVATGTGYTVGDPSSAEVTVRDNDGSGPRVRIRAQSSTVTEGQTATFILDSVDDGTATLTILLRVEETGDMLTATVPNSVTTFSPTTVVALLEVGTVNDSADEPNSTITVTVVDGPGYELGIPESATVAVADNDGEALVTIAGTSESVTEGEPAQFTVTRTGSTASALSVSLEVSDTRSAISGTPPSSITILSGSATATLSVPTADNATDENDRLVVAEVLRGTGYVPGTPNAAVVTVSDDDAATLTVRISGRRLSNGKAELALQQRGAGGQWGDRLLPTTRLLSATATVDTWHVTSSLTVTSAETADFTELRIAARRLASGKIEVALQQKGSDGEWDDRQLPTSRFISATATVDRWQNSSSLTVTTVAPAGTRESRSQSEQPKDDPLMEEAPADATAGNGQSDDAANEEAMGTEP